MWADGMYGRKALDSSERPGMGTRLPGRPVEFIAGWSQGRRHLRSCSCRAVARVQDRRGPRVRAGVGVLPMCMKFDVIYTRLLYLHASLFSQLFGFYFLCGHSSVFAWEFMGRGYALSRPCEELFHCRSPTESAQVFMTFLATF